MKKSVILFILMFAYSVLISFSCTKQAEQKSAPQTMSALELKARFGISLPGLDYSDNSVARGKKASAQTVVVWFDDLILSGSVICTVSPNAQWGAIQKFLAEPLSNDGATVLCNFYLPVSEMNCPTTAPGVYRGWTSDFDYNVHISNLITIQ